MRGVHFQDARFPRDAGSPKKDSRYFSKTAGNINRLNGWANPLRGGWRL